MCFIQQTPLLMQLPQCDSDVTDVRDVLARAATLLSDAGIYRWGAGKRWIWTAYGSWEPQALQLLRHSAPRPSALQLELPPERYSDPALGLDGTGQLLQP